MFSSNYFEVTVHQILIELFLFKDSSHTTSFQLLDGKTMRLSSICALEVTVYLTSRIL